jgi:biotin carboxylase
MVLGGGSAQLNLIQRAKALGDFVIVADYLPDCPGGRLADVHVTVSSFDSAGVIRAAREYGAQGIVTTGTDQPVLTAALTAEALSLPFYMDSETALRFTNKRVMKALFKQHDIPANDYVLLGVDFAPEELESFRFPGVLKPVDSQGQRGIFLVDNEEDVRRYIGETLRYSREDKVLLETYYQNDEITVNGWVVGGRATVLSVVDRLTIRGTRHIGVCLCHHYPSVHLASRRDEIQALTQRIVTALGMHSGPLYFQYLVGAEGIRVNEVAARIGGAYEDLTMPLINNIDILGMLLDYVRTGACDTRPLQGFDVMRQNRYVSTQLFFCRPGKVSRIIAREAMMALPGVHDLNCVFGPGSDIPTIENATARAGYMIIEGSSFSDMIGRVNQAFDVLKITDAAGTNLIIPYADYPDKYYFGNPKT